jgi:recombination protein RecA
VIDSVAALVPKAELDGEMGDSHMGLHARLMSQALRKLTGVVSRTNTCMIFINQVREKIGVMFGSPETTTGGRALKFYSSVRTEVRRIGAIKDGETIVGNRTKAKIVKNKVAAVPGSRVRYSFRRRRVERGRFDRPGSFEEHCRQVRVMV